MRITVSVDDELLRKAQKYTGITQNPELFTAGLRALVERAAAHRLAQRGGTAPDMQHIPRRRLEPA